MLNTNATVTTNNEYTLAGRERAHSGLSRPRRPYSPVHLMFSQARCPNSACRLFTPLILQPNKSRFAGQCYAFRFKINVECGSADLGALLRCWVDSDTHWGNLGAGMLLTMSLCSCSSWALLSPIAIRSRASCLNAAILSCDISFVFVLPICTWCSEPRISKKQRDSEGGSSVIQGEAPP